MTCAKNSAEGHCLQAAELEETVIPVHSPLELSMPTEQRKGASA